MFDIMMVGQVCQDTNIDFGGAEETRIGGPVLYSGHSADALGANVAVLTKNAPGIDAAAQFSDCRNVKIFQLESSSNTKMENVYFTADRERRKCRCLAVIDPYRPEELPQESAAVYHIAGLIYGDIGSDVVKACAKKGKVAIDVQCMMRKREDDMTLNIYDWDDKLELLPLVDYLKTDAAEAEKLTGTDDREKAARMLYDWGAKEIMITHNTEVIVFDGKQIYRVPLKPRNLTGRTGRGDTTFAAYLTERRTKSIPDSLLVAAATVSLKMETPGPFTGTRADVEKYIKDFYPEFQL